MEEAQGSNTKQFIVMRHGLTMHIEQQAAHGAHASMSFPTRSLQSKSTVCLDVFTLCEQTWIMVAVAKLCTTTVAASPPNPMQSSLGSLSAIRRRTDCFRLFNTASLDILVPVGINTLAAALRLRVARCFNRKQGL
jgi:hypothetical protein